MDIFSLYVRAYICTCLTRKGLLGTLTSPQVMMMVCLRGLTGVYTHRNVPSPLSVILMLMVHPSASLVDTKACQLWSVLTRNIKDMFLWIENVGVTNWCFPYLCIDLELSLPSHAGINSEFSWFVYSHASWLQTWTISFHLQPQNILMYFVGI